MNSVLVIQLSRGLLGLLMIPAVIVGGAVSFTSVSIMANTTLYAEIGNEDKPSDSDPVQLDALAQRHICRDIARSGYFRAMDAGLAVIGNLRSSQGEAYTLQDFEINSQPGRQRFREYVFECKFSKLQKVVSYFVSKEYDVSPINNREMPGRFVFVRYTVNEFSYILLAEAPAESYSNIKPTFDIELHYRRIRMQAHSVESTADPLCALIHGRHNNYHHRLCTSVCTSISTEYLAPRDRIYAGYAVPNQNPCRLEKVGFRTDKDLMPPDRKPYEEQMTVCDCSFRELELEVPLYISRAYFSNQILVYRRDPSDEIIYLERLARNVGIVDELNSFDFVEA